MVLTIFKNISQWEGWHPIYEMENKQCSKPQPDDVPMNTWLFGILRNTIHAQGPFSKSVRIIPNGPAKTTNPEKLSRVIEQQRLI